jgi:hypothetical protein
MVDVCELGNQFEFRKIWFVFQEQKAARGLCSKGGLVMEVQNTTASPTASAYIITINLLYFSEIPDTVRALLVAQIQHNGYWS